MSKRIVFTFNNRSFEALQDMQAMGGFESLAEAVRMSIVVMRTIQKQSRQGYSLVNLVNPETQDTRTIIMPDLVLKDKE